jgi:predicted enzyme involved in methoxymalonyl-ACP biosynthesis
MEFAMLDTLVKECKERSVDTVIGHYYPTAKNGMVRNLFGDFGFEKIFEGEDGTTEWKLSVTDYKNQNNVIKVNSEE